MEIKIVNPVKAFKLFDLSPVSISPSKHNIMIRKPDIFKIDRSPNRHLTFGYGPHLCIGAALAREEGRIAILNFFKQYPTTRLKAENSFEWIDAMVPRGLKKLDVNLT